MCSHGAANVNCVTVRLLALKTDETARVSPAEALRLHGVLACWLSAPASTWTVKFVYETVENKPR
jgi:hypothetical protein